MMEQPQQATSLVLYGKADCHLCDDAAAILQRVASELGVSWSKVDITTDPAVFERFKYRIPVIEIMMATPLVRKYIMEGEFEKLKGTVGNRESGSQSFDQHLTELFQKQIIDVNEAKRLASNVDALTLALRGITNSDTRLK